MPVPRKSQPSEGGTATLEKPKPKKAEKSARAILYPRYETMICCLPTPHAETGEVIEYDGPITVELAKKLLGWETDDEYVRRRMTEDPSLKETKLRESDYLLKDRNGSKIRCRHNTLNRPFDAAWARKIAQDILTEGYEFNGEDIIVGVTGLVLSGQHRLVALVLAYEEWMKNGRAYQKYWRDREPFIESLIFVGAREDQAVLQTYDNVKPRSLSDTIYTSPIFANKSGTDKKRLSTMLDQCIDWLWRRLDATSNKFVEHQTHSASLDFLDRHEKHMVAAVKHVHDLDGSEEGLALSTLGLNAGRTAGMLFLMGCSATNEDKANAYHELTSPKAEKQLDWTAWEKALQFWRDVVENKKPWVEELRKGLANLNDENLTGRVSDTEKCAVVAIAWAEYANGNEGFAVDDILPEREVNKATNEFYLVDGGPTFGLVDKGPPQKQKGTKEEQQSQEQDEEAVKAARAARLKEIEEHNKTVLKADTDRKVVPNPTAKGAGTLNGRGKKTAPEPEPADDNEFSLADGGGNPASTEGMSIDEELSLEQGVAEEMNRETVKKGKEARKAVREAKKRK